MAQPSTRQELIDYCLRKLGAPVLEVNVAQEQIEDLVDDAVQLFQERHFDGVYQTYLKYKVTQEDKYIKAAMGAPIRRVMRDLITLVLKKIEVQLNHIEAKTKKERLILDRLAPGHFSFNYEGGMYQEIRNQDHAVWENHELFILLEKFVKQVDTGRYLDRLEEMTNFFLDEAIVACRELGI